MPEEIEMIQEMIQVIQVAAGFVSWLQGGAFSVGGIEILGKSAKQFCHGKVCLGMAHVGRRINQPCPAIPSCDDVARPKVAVKQGGVFRLYQKVLQSV